MSRSSSEVWFYLAYLMSDLLAKEYYFYICGIKIIWLIKMKILIKIVEEVLSQKKLEQYEKSFQILHEHWTCWIWKWKSICISNTATEFLLCQWSIVLQYLTVHSYTEVVIFMFKFVRFHCFLSTVMTSFFTPVTLLMYPPYSSSHSFYLTSEIITSY